MKQLILLVHGQGRCGTFSIPKVKTITPAGHSLRYADALKYFNSSKSYPEYASTSFSDKFYGLTDKDCKAMFGKVPSGEGIVFSGKYRGNDLNKPIFCLRGGYITSVMLETYIKKLHYTSVILLACRD